MPPKTVPTDNQTDSVLFMLRPRSFSYQMYVPTEPASKVVAKDLPL
jgi:hypothetical protein